MKWHMDCTSIDSDNRFFLGGIHFVFANIADINVYIANK